MKIITWNCCLKLSSKFETIKKLHADILIIQECEKLPKDYFPGAEYHWIGHQDNKGVGVVLFNLTAEIDKAFNDKLDYFENLKALYLIGIVAIGLMFYLLVAILIKAFKKSDINQSF